ncbi:MAG: nodulation protein NfeD, partial [Chloroflexota bacterium]|nr:nodulation protein NfeD [Chloroflexota bacterium]
RGRALGRAVDPGVHWRRVRRVASLAAIVLGVLVFTASSRAGGDHVVRLRLTGIVDPVNATYVEEGLRAAADAGAAAVVLEIDSPGGALSAMDRVIKAILDSDVPVISYVAPSGARAGSAATFITLAGDVAAMAPATNIGAASVVDANGSDIEPTLRRKITNDAVARIRELADRRERNADWAESAVRDAASIGSAEAVAMDPPVVDILAADVGDLFAQVDLGERRDGIAYRFRDAPLPRLSGLEVRDASLNLGQQVLHLLSDPNIAFLLFTIGFYGILAELFHPNFFSGTLGAIALLLAFISFDSLPLNVAGLLLIALGVGLLVLELHVTSYGLLTVGGIASFILGAFALYTRVEPGEPVGLRVHPAVIAAVAGMTLLYFAVVLRAVFVSRRQRTRGLPIGRLVGAAGTAQTELAPTGVAYSEGESWSARARDGVIAPGTPIRVVRVEGLELIVEPAAPREVTNVKEATRAAG